MKRKFFAYPYIVWMILFIVVPMFFIFYYAVNIGGEFTLRTFWKTLSDFTNNWLVLWNSIVIALETTVICLLVAYPIAYILSNMKKSVAGFISLLFFVPMWMNFILRTYSWYAILEYFIPQLIGRPDLSFTGTRFSVLLVLAYDFLPFMLLPLYNTLSKIDKSLIEASRDLGANSFNTFFRVILPLSVPGIVSGVTMVFVPAITTFTVPAIIGNGVFTLYGSKIDEAFHEATAVPGDFSKGSTLSIILVICVLISTLIMNHFDKDKEAGGNML